MSACAVTLLPIRIVALVLGFGLTSLYALGVSPMLPKNATAPMTKFQRMLTAPFAFSSRLILWCLGFWHIKVVDQRLPTDPKAGIVVSNHVSYCDPPMLFWWFRGGFVAKYSVSKWPVVGSVAKGVQTIFVNRRDPDSKKKCLAAIQTKASNPGMSTPLIIFPEGTTTNGKCLVTFKDGPFIPGQPVQPVAIEYHYTDMNPACVGWSSAVKYFFALLTQFHQGATLTILRPVIPTDAEKKDARAFGTRVRSIIAAHLGLPVTRHTYDDVFLYNAALQSHIPQSFEMEEVKAVTGLGWQKVERLMKTFGQQIDSNHDGSVEYEEFCELLELDSGSGRNMEIFDMLDVNGDGHIQFVEFISGLMLLSKDSTFPLKERAAMAFKILNTQGTGVVHQEAIREVFKRGRIDEEETSSFIARIWAELPAGGERGMDFEAFWKIIKKSPPLVQPPLNVAIRSLQAHGLDTEALEPGDEKSAGEKKDD